MKSHVEVIETIVAGEKERWFCVSMQIGVSRNTMKLYRSLDQDPTETRTCFILPFARQSLSTESS